MNLKVSICCITFNHVQFIRECLDSFLMQKTDFLFEVLIHDDASTDGTAEIIKEYQQKYPDIIKPVYQTENQWSKGIRNIQSKYNFPRAKGKYIAMCEGDDYWTDPNKLQKQVDFLENNKDIGLVFSNCEQHFISYGELIRKKIGIDKCVEDRIYSRVEILENWLIPTASVLFRSENLNIEEFSALFKKYNFHYGDTPLYLYITRNTKIYGMKEVFCVYNRHENGVTKINEFSNLGFIKNLINISKCFGKEFISPKIKLKIAKKYVEIYKITNSKKYLIKGLKYDPKLFKYLLLEIYNDLFIKCDGK